MFAMLCSKPLITKSMMGKYRPASFPPVVFADMEHQTATHTRKLHRMPLHRASWRLRPTFFSAVARITSPKTPENMEGRCPPVTRSATSTLPKRFPRYTRTQFRSISGIRIRPCIRGITSRLFPVKSSVPHRITMARPPGKSRALMSFPTPSLLAPDTAMEPAVEAAPARAMNMPERIPESSSAIQVILTFFSPAPR